jgi:dUTP pyrophosphatase
MMNIQPNVGIHKLHPSAFDPVYATEGSACFDLKACFAHGHNRIVCYSKLGHSSILLAAAQIDGDPIHIVIPPGDRVLVPTQLVFDIPWGWSMRLHMRSGLALKSGLSLSNSEGIIDSDYVEQVMVAITNTSEIPVRINHGDRICQAEFIPHVQAVFHPCPKPEPKTTRVGGFGSTGKN